MAIRGISNQPREKRDFWIVHWYPRYYSNPLNLTRLFGFHSSSFVIVPKRRRKGRGLVRNTVFLRGEEHGRVKGVIGIGIGEHREQMVDLGAVRGRE